MINKRKLDEVIQKATYNPERDCAYTFEEYSQTPFMQEHVCDYVSKFWMPYVLVTYLYNDCYYDDIETVQANLDYINQTMPTVQFYHTWKNMTMDMILEEIEEYKDKEAKKQAEPAARSYDDDIVNLEQYSYDDDLGDLIDN